MPEQQPERPLVPIPGGAARIDAMPEGPEADAAKQRLHALNEHLQNGGLDPLEDTETPAPEAAMPTEQEPESALAIAMRQARTKNPDWQPAVEAAPEESAPVDTTGARNPYFAAPEGADRRAAMQATMDALAGKAPPEPEPAPQEPLPEPAQPAPEPAPQEPSPEPLPPAPEVVPMPAPEVAQPEAMPTQPEAPEAEEQEKPSAFRKAMEFISGRSGELEAYMQREGAGKGWLGWAEKKLEQYHKASWKKKLGLTAALVVGTAATSAAGIGFLPYIFAAGLYAQRVAGAGAFALVRRAAIEAAYQREGREASDLQKYGRALLQAGGYLGGTAFAAHEAVAAAEPWLAHVLGHTPSAAPAEAPPPAAPIAETPMLHVTSPAPQVVPPPIAHAPAPMPMHTEAVPQSLQVSPSGAPPQEDILKTILPSPHESAMHTPLPDESAAHLQTLAGRNALPHDVHEMLVRVTPGRGYEDMLDHLAKQLHDAYPDGLPSGIDPHSDAGQLWDAYGRDVAEGVTYTRGHLHALIHDKLAAGGLVQKTAEMRVGAGGSIEFSQTGGHFAPLVPQESAAAHAASAPAPAPASEAAPATPAQPVAPAPPAPEAAAAAPQPAPPVTPPVAAPEPPEMPHLTPRAPAVPPPPVEAAPMAPSSPPVPQPTPTLQPSARWASFSDIPVRQYSAPVEHVAPAMPPAHPDVPPPAPVPAESAHAAPPPPAPVEAAVQHFVVNKWGVPVVDNVPHIYSNMPAHDAVNNFGDVPTHEIGSKHERLFAYGNGTTQQEHEAFADFIGRYFQQNPHVKEIIAPDNTHTHSVVWSRAANGQVQATLFPTTPKHFFGMLGGKSLPLPTPGEFKRMVL